ncbi:proton-coupled folate transporter-like [Petromyzon marinus]|uniref:Proton-coupled folate transporter-like n=1 Tax=Petromyzon marinus TaxID=7757 RepID=A0AAJ7TLS3_PETMA|nr:proton-coupled folate transporter-like [Petromyzon marinus]XP_032818911.1 proton-coupled folate transporter-like [Petromyzon marinus]XP_032818913.1 proton-coupled folate transporter-like [Petromyzon marinus]
MAPSWARVITVEPLLFLYMTALFIQAPATQQIILQKVCWETYGTTEACVSPLEGDQARVVQTGASTLFLLQSLATNIPAMITASLLGTWSDRSACMRRLAMTLPCFGAAMASALLMVVSSSPELSVYWTLAASCIASALGGYVTILLSVMSYLATVTSPDERPCRMGVLEAMIFMGGTVGGLVEGAAVAHMGFLGVFSIQLACNLLATLYALLCIASPAEQRSNEDERQPICSEESEDTGVRATVPPMSCLDGLTTWKVVFRKRGERGRLVMLLLLAVSLLNMACIVGDSQILVMFLQYPPLHFTNEQYGYFSGGRTFLVGMCLLVLFPLLLKLARGFTLAKGAMLIRVISFGLMACASAPWMVFLAGGLASVSGIPGAMIRAQTSRLATRSEQGAVFSAFASLETAFMLVTSSVLNALYPATLPHFPGFCFILLGGLAVIMLILLQWIDKESRFLQGATSSPSHPVQRNVN